MDNSFSYDVFICYSRKNKNAVSFIVDKLRNDGLKVWFDGDKKSGVDSQTTIEDGLEKSRTLLFCMSKDAFAVDWPRLENYILRFRDPSNNSRRFVPLRLDKSPIKDSLKQFVFIDWTGDEREAEYIRLLKVCRLEGHKLTPEIKSWKCIHVLKGHKQGVWAIAISSDKKIVVTGSKDKSIGIWDTGTGECIRTLTGHSGAIRDVTIGSNGHLYSASDDNRIGVWSLATGQLITFLTGHTNAIHGLRLSPDEKLLASGSADLTIRVWDTQTMTCKNVLNYSNSWVNSLVFLPDPEYKVLAGTEDGLIISWDIDQKKKINFIGKHRSWVWSLAFAKNSFRLISGSGDSTVGVWNIYNQSKIGVLEGHYDKVSKVAITNDGLTAISGSLDNTARIWDLEIMKTSQILKGHKASVESVALSEDGMLAITGSNDKEARIWLFEKADIQKEPVLDSNRSYYTNAKVLLIGEGGSGKTALSKRLAHNSWQPSNPTVGAWATQWKLPVAPTDDTEREIWLWDFGGQADQRLIHQLYLDEIAVAVLVFDGQKEDFLETLSQWDRDLIRASSQVFAKILVAGRTDISKIRMTKERIELYAKERGYARFIETSARDGQGCEELRNAILNSIRWEKIPWNSSPYLFKRLKDNIVQLKDQGRILMRFNELRDTLLLKHSEDGRQFKDEELKAVLGLLTGPGIVWELKFGNWILLRPEYIDTYAQAVIRTIQADKFERGSIMEESVLNGALSFPSEMVRLPADEERFVLLTMHQMLVERCFCLREFTDKGSVLIFPSYFKRERPVMLGQRTVVLSYRFNGFLDDIYSTLVVSLHYTRAFRQDQLWHYAADFKTLTGKQLGIRLNKLAEGSGELEVYFDHAISLEEKIIFSKYVHEHLLQKAKDVLRLRHYVCPHCGIPVGDREIAMKKLSEGKKDILCVNCDDVNKRIPLWDEMEELFSSSEIKQKVSGLRDETIVILDNESKERALVGEVISTVALAGQISREKTVSDHGIDMEIEFKNDNNEPAGRYVFLQLKSGDSHIKKRKQDGAEIFTIQDERHIRYWRDQPFPVMLIIRDAKGKIRWMNVRDYLREAGYERGKPVKQVIFKGEQFDVSSVRRLRDIVLAR